jgi:hypothetical protein
MVIISRGGGYMGRALHRQYGLTLISLILISALLVSVAIVAMKIFPVVVDYYTILADVKAVSADTSLREGSVQQIRTAYRKRMDVSGAKDIGPDDLDISKEGNDIVISFAYSKKIHLVANASLLLDFEANTSSSSN